MRAMPRLQQIEAMRHPNLTIIQAGERGRDTESGTSPGSAADAELQTLPGQIPRNGLFTPSGGERQRNPMHC